MSASVTASEFRQVPGQYPTGVVIVTVMPDASLLA